MALDTLPAELLVQILTEIVLEADDLLSISSVSRSLRDFLQQADALWRLKLEKCCHMRLSSPRPAATYRELHRSLYPFWFLVRSRLWISTVLPRGELSLLFYNQASSAIEGYPLTARHGPRTRVLKFFDAGPTDLFCPGVVGLGIYQDPTVMIEPRALEHRVNHAVQMNMWTRNIRQLCMTKKAASALHATAKTNIWPPPALPAAKGHRTIVPCNDIEGISSQTPQDRAQLSEASFRRVANPRSYETITTETWGALSESSLKYDEDRPWQGLWCSSVDTWSGFQFVFLRHVVDRELLSQTGHADDRDDAYLRLDGQHGTYSSGFSPAGADGPRFTGGLEATKLTGVELMPRGSRMFVVPDLSKSGWIRSVNTLPTDNTDHDFPHGVYRALVPTFNSVELEDSELLVMDRNTLALRYPRGRNSVLERVDIDRVFLSARSLGS